MIIILSFIYLLPPMLAILVSFWAESPVAGYLLFVAGIAFAVLFTVTQIAGWDCEFDDFMFHSCGLIPESVASIIGAVSILGMATYFIGGPLVLVCAAGLEWHKRRQNTR